MCAAAAIDQFPALQQRRFDLSQCSAPRSRHGRNLRTRSVIYQRLLVKLQALACAQYERNSKPAISSCRAGRPSTIVLDRHGAVSKILVGAHRFDQFEAAVRGVL